MRDVVVIGGGLTGLAAAWELQTLGVPYTLIEVKTRLGGSIFSERRDGFLLDSAPLVEETGRPLLAELGLEQAVYTTLSQRFGALHVGSGAARTAGVGCLAFKDGSGVLVDTLSRRLTGAILTRMAVSSVGNAAGRFTLCLENGLMLHAAALIVALAARYAAHLFRTFQPELSEHLLNFEYDPIARVWLGYPHAMPQPVALPPDLLSIHPITDQPYRVPPGAVLYEATARLDAQRGLLPGLVQSWLDCFDWPPPQLSHVHYWPEEVVLPPSGSAYPTSMESLLPERVALVGSDYTGLDIIHRVEQGRAAARRVAQQLR